MTAHLKIYSSRAECETGIMQSKVSAAPLVSMALDRTRYYIKMASPRPNVEPKYLCTDGRWRKYDEIPELPHSTAALNAEEKP